MTPYEFEKIIGDEFRNRGFEINLTPKSYDYGVDIIADNKTDRIAIQVKMYESREVNYRDIMYLFAGMHYYKCNKSLMITQRNLDFKAKETAKKLNVDFREFYQPTLREGKREHRELERSSDFDAIWTTFIVPLQGQTILTGTGKKNIVIKVTGDYLYRQSSTGEKSKLEKDIFEIIYHRLKEKKEITRQEINTEYSNRGSAIIAAVLSKIPYIQITEK